MQMRNRFADLRSMKRYAFHGIIWPAEPKIVQQTEYHNRPKKKWICNQKFNMIII